MKLKRIVAAIALLTLLTVMPSLAASDTTVVLDRSNQLAGMQAYIENGTTFVPLRAFSETVGATRVSWNSATNCAVVQGNGLEITVMLGRNYIVANERCFYTAKPAVLRSDTLYVPLRPLAKAYGLSVQWDAAAYAVQLTTGSGPCAPGSEVYQAEDLYWLSRIINAESEGEPLLGKIAVGNVVLNRVADSEFPDNVYDVVFDRNNGVQFTPVANGTIYRAPVNESIVAAKIALEGVQVLGVKCNYFVNESTAQSAWVQLNRPRVAVVGNHSFFE